MTTDRLLDVGCGDGRVAVSLGWHQEYKYVGLDNDKQRVKAARDRGLDARRVDVTEGLPFSANEFDKVVCKAILEHLPQPRATLRECYRVLKPRGELRVIVPTDRSYDVWGDSTHRRAYRRDALADDLDGAGFVIHEIAGRMGWTHFGQAFKSVLRMLNPATPYGYPRAWDATAYKPSGAGP